MDVLSFWVSAAFGRLHPSVIQMLGGSEFRLRQGFRLWRKRLYGALAPPHVVGPHLSRVSFCQHFPRRRGRHIVRGDFLQKSPLTHSVAAPSQLRPAALTGAGVTGHAEDKAHRLSGLWAFPLRRSNGLRNVS